MVATLRIAGALALLGCLVASGSADETVTIWINAFIPKEVADVTESVKAGPHQGKTQLVVPKLFDSYLTDQRDFSDDPTASSRMHSEATITFQANGSALTQKHRCDPTVKLDRKAGTVTCEKSAGTDRMSFTGKSLGAKRAEITFNCAAKNPCIAPAPDIDLIGTVVIDLDAKTVTLTSKVEPFPAFEAYARLPSGKVAKLNAVRPLPGKDPANLVGDPNRELSGVVKW